MSLSAVGSNANVVDLFKQRRNAMQAMEAAVQQGSIEAAQQNLATVQQDSQNIQSILDNSNGSSDTNPYRSTLKTDLTNLTNSVASGDIASAQTALSQFQQDKQAFEGGAGSPSSTPWQGDSATGQPNSILGDVQSLFLSALSGDAAGAQNAATSLTNDLKNAAGVPVAPASQASSSTTSQPTTASSASNSASAFLNDLKSLIDAAQSGDTNGAQQAALKLAADSQNAIGGPSGATGHHHHHHHHHQEESSDSASFANTTPLSETVEGATSSASSSVADSATTIPRTSIQAPV
jgi:ribosomal protein S20